MRLRRVFFLICILLIVLLGSAQRVRSVAICRGSLTYSIAKCVNNFITQEYTCATQSEKQYCGWSSNRCESAFVTNPFCQISIDKKTCISFNHQGDRGSSGCSITWSAPTPTPTSGGTSTPSPTPSTGGIGLVDAPPSNYFCADWCTNAGDACPAGCSGASGVCSNGGSCCSCSTVNVDQNPRCTDGGVVRFGDGRRCGYLCPGNAGNCVGNASWTGGQKQSPDGNWVGGGSSCSAPNENYDACMLRAAQQCCDGPPYGKCEVSIEMSTSAPMVSEKVDLKVNKLFSEVGWNNVGLLHDGSPVGLQLGGTSADYISSITAGNAGVHSLQFSINSGYDRCNVVPYTAYQRPSCAISVNGSAVTAGQTINVLQGSTVSLAATGSIGSTETGIRLSPTTPQNAWLTAPYRPNGVSTVGLNWTAQPMNGVSSFYAVCNNINPAGICSGNPWCESGTCYTSTGEQYLDCGTGVNDKDKVILTVLPVNLACNASCVSSQQCGGGFVCTGTATVPGFCRNNACKNETDCACAGGISGILFDATQNTCMDAITSPPVTGVQIQAVNTADTSKVYTSVVSNSNGEFSITNMPVPGTYQVSVLPAGLSALGYVSSPRYVCKSSVISLTSADSGKIIAGNDFGFWQSVPSWFQVMGGNILAEQRSGIAISTDIPESCVSASCAPRSLLAKSRSSVSESSGYASVGQGGNLSTNGNSSYPYTYLREASAQAFSSRVRGASVVKHTYTQLYQRYGLGSTPTALANTNISAYRGDLQNISTHLPANPERQAYYSSGDVTILQPWTVKSGQSLVIFVNGSLTVKNTITVETGGFLAFVTKGNILFSNSVSTTNEASVSPLVSGVFVSDGTITVASNGPKGSNPKDDKFIGSGTFVGWTGIELNRDYRAGTTDIASTLRTYDNPSELFIERPDFALLLPEKMKQPLLDWHEIAP